MWNVRFLVRRRKSDAFHSLENKAGLWYLGKIGHNASEKVIFALIKSKCLPVLLYGIEACLSYSAAIQSLQFTIATFSSWLFVFVLSTENFQRRMSE